MSLISLIEILRTDSSPVTLEPVTGKITRAENTHASNPLTVQCRKDGAVVRTVTVAAGRYMDFWYDGAEWKIMAEIDVNYDTLPLTSRTDDPAAVSGKDIIYFKEHRPFYRKGDGTIEGINSTGDLTGINQRLHSGTSTTDHATAFKRQRTLNTSHGFWGEILWVSANTIIIKPKSDSGHSWIGVILNDGKYMERTTDYPITYDVGSSGNIIDGMPKLNNEWFIVWGYEDSNGELAFGITWMPKATINNATAPTTSVTLNKVPPTTGQDIGKLFPVNSHFVMVNSTNPVTKLETPIYASAGTPSGYTPSKNLYIASRTDMDLMFNQQLSVPNFSSGDTIYQVDGFMPLQVSGGAIASVIGSRGYRDIGFRFRTDGTGSISKFIIRGKRVYWIANSYSTFIISLGISAAVYQSNHFPPDCKHAVANPTLALSASGVNCYIYSYFDITAGNEIYYTYNYQIDIKTADIPVMHKMFGQKSDYSMSENTLRIYGYVMEQ